MLWNVLPMNFSEEVFWLFPLCFTSDPHHPCWVSEEFLHTFCKTPSRTTIKLLKYFVSIGNGRRRLWNSPRYLSDMLGTLWNVLSDSWSISRQFYISLSRLHAPPQYMGNAESSRKKRVVRILKTRSLIKKKMLKQWNIVQFIQILKMVFNLPFRLLWIDHKVAT